MEDIIMTFKEHFEWNIFIKKVGGKFYGRLVFDTYSCGQIVGDTLEECVNKSKETIELILDTIPLDVLSIKQPFVVIKNDASYYTPIFHTLIRACQRLSVKIYDMVNNDTIDYPDLIKYVEEYRAVKNGEWETLELECIN